MWHDDLWHDDLWVQDFWVGDDSDDVDPFPGEALGIGSRRLNRRRYGGLWCLLLIPLLTGCATEVVDVFECRCRIEYWTPFATQADSINYVVFDTLPTVADCQEAGAKFCPTA